MTELSHVSFDAELPDVHGYPGRFAERGVDCGELDETDYSFFLFCEVEQGSFRVEVGYVDDEDGRQWLAYVVARKTWIAEEDESRRVCDDRAAPRRPDDRFRCHTSMGSPRPNGTTLRSDGAGRPPGDRRLAGPGNTLG